MAESAKKRVSVNLALIGKIPEGDCEAVCSRGVEVLVVTIPVTVFQQHYVFLMHHLTITTSVI